MARISHYDVSGFLFESGNDSFSDFYNIVPVSGHGIIIGHDKVSIECCLASGSTDYVSGKNNDLDEIERFFDAASRAVKNNWNPLILAPENFGDSSSSDFEKSLAERVEKEHSCLLKRGGRRHFYGAIPEGDCLIELVLQNTGISGVDDIIQHYVEFLCWDAEKSVLNKLPNYSINLPALIEVISKCVGKQFSFNVPDFIKGHSFYFGHNRLAAFSEKNNFVQAIVQLNGCPFTYDDVLKSETKIIVAGKNDGVEKSRAIFDWIRANIEYDHKKERPIGVNYRGALQTFRDRMGVCGEQASLQVVMERLVGENAFYAKVNLGELKHACAAHFTQDNRVILVDPTCEFGFDCKYDDIKIVSDEETEAAGYY